MKVLLTGANGFVGSHIAEMLVQNGHNVVTLVRQASNHKWLKGLSAEFVSGDICHPHTLEKAVKGVDAIIHCAGLVRALKIENYYHVNQHGTRNLVETALCFNPHLKKFIYISSQAAMGPSPDFRAKHVHEKENPVSDYGKSKLAGEKELVALSGKIPFTILRPAAVYGPRDKDIFIFFNLVHRGLRPKTFEDRFIQMLFVKDLALAAISALSNKNSDDKTYFLAEEKFYTWEDMSRTIAQALGKSSIPLPLPDLVLHGASFFAENISKLFGKPAVLNRQKIIEMMQTYWLADNTAAKKDLKMDFTKLDFGAKITYSWYKENNWL